MFFCRRRRRLFLVFLLLSSFISISEKKCVNESGDVIAVAILGVVVELYFWLYCCYVVSPKTLFLSTFFLWAVCVCTTL